jgi:hypothetical protein
MARPPTPIPILVERGSVRKNPQRYRDRIASEPKSRGPLGSPPAHWDTRPECYYHERNERWCAIWRELDGQMPKGTLKASDRFLVERLCQLMDRQRLHPLDIKPAEDNVLLAMLAKIGLTPVDRMRVVSDERGRNAQKSSAWEKFA